MAKPLVSFVMPTYNREAYLVEAINSCLDQTYKNIEVVVVNDGSTDGTDDIMQFLSEKHDNIRYIKLSDNSGIAIARNSGIQEAKGEYIAVMDSDDLCSPDRIKKQITTIKDNDFSYSAYLAADKNAKVFQAIQAPKDFTKEDIRLNRSIPHVTIMAKRECFTNHMYRPELTANDDKALLIDWFKAGYKGKRVREPLMIVRFHETNTSETKKKLIDKINEELDAEIA
jgi:teichuronic acid biosynthesis glycosyltransferase TuaG